MSSSPPFPALILRLLGTLEVDLDGQPLAPQLLAKAQALRLYQGELLSGFSVRRAPDFERWLYAEQERLHLLALRGLETLAQVQAQTGQFETAIAHLRRALTLEPWREEAHRALMNLLAHSGQRSAALAQYEVCRLALADELGVAPGQETVDLYQRIQRGAINVEPPDLPVEPASSAAPVPLAVDVDWGEAPLNDPFFGREAELAQVHQWLVDDNCRMVILLGMGGVGKTRLAVQVVKALLAQGPGAQGQPFARILWRSLLNAPTLHELLQQVIPFLSDQAVTLLPESVDDQLHLLRYVLQSQRCLLIPDNVESLLQPQEQGSYRPGYEAYSQLFHLFAQSKHQSCLLVTSRERPKEFVQPEAATHRIHVLMLGGLAPEASDALLAARGVVQQPAEKAQLVTRYEGHPMALTLVAETIRDLYGGDVAAFLAEEVVVFADVRDVLDQQFARLSPLEQELLVWLAIEREPVLAQTLWEDLAQPPSRRAFLETLRALRRRSLLEVHAASAGALPRFALQNVVSEYLTDLLVETVSRELESGQFAYAMRYALLQAQAKEYVRESQARLILQPVANWLRRVFGQADAAAHLRALLDQLRQMSPRPSGYAAGNVLNLLVYLQGKLDGEDFSELAVWQAYLRGVQAQRVRFRQAEMAGSAFTDTFGAVTAVAFRPDGQRLAAATGIGEIRVWQMPDRQPLLTCPGYTWIYTLSFSPDGDRIASGSYDGTVRVWDAHSGRALHTLAGHSGRVYAVAFRPDGQLIASGGQDASVQMWDVQRGQRLHTLSGHTGLVRSVAFSPDGATLASGGHDDTVRLWDAQNGQLRANLYTGAVRTLCFSPDGAWLATGHRDKMLRLWEVASGAWLRTFQGHEGEVKSVAFSPDGATLASGSQDCTVRLWNVASGRCLHTLYGHAEQVESVCFSPDGSMIASGSEDHSIRLWEAASGRCLFILHGHTQWVGSICFSADGHTLVSAGEDPAVHLWDVQSGGYLRGLSGHSDWVNILRFSPDGSVLASASDDETVRLWEIHSGACLHVLRGHIGEINMIAFSPDGARIASGSKDATLRLWDVANGHSLYSVRAHTGRIYAVCRGPHGLLASGGQDNRVHLWNERTGQQVGTFEGQTLPLRADCFSPDGHTLATVGADAVHLWDVRSRGHLHALRGHTEWINVLCFSADGSLIATGSQDHTICLWEAGSGRCLYTLRGHMDAVHDLTFRPDGSVLASASPDASVRLWDTGTGACLAILRNRPYEQMDITGASGLTESQKIALKRLGAVDAQEN